MKTNFNFIASILIFFGTLSALLISCEEHPKVKEKYPHYTYGTDTYIPDSMKIQYANWVKETVAAASNHMTGGDYEDPEDVIEQAEESGKRIFESKAEGLYRVLSEGQWREFIPKERLTKEELVILEKLKK